MTFKLYAAIAATLAIFATVGGLIYYRDQYHIVKKELSDKIGQLNDERKANDEKAQRIGNIQRDYDDKMEALRRAGDVCADRPVPDDVFIVLCRKQDGSCAKRVPATGTP